MSPKSESGELRKVVVVGHDVKQDVQYLNSLDFDVNEMENLLEVVDNQKLHQHRSKFYNGQSLCTVLAGLKIPYRFLHNAGNDAVYTLQSLLRLAVLKRHESLVRAWEKQASYVVAINVQYTAPADRPSQVRHHEPENRARRRSRMEHWRRGYRWWSSYCPTLRYNKET